MTKRISNVCIAIALAISVGAQQKERTIALWGHVKNSVTRGGINRFTLYSNRLMISKEEDNDSRCIQLSLRYRFNVTPSKYKGTGAGNSEKNRL